MKEKRKEEKCKKYNKIIIIIILIVIIIVLINNNFTKINVGNKDVYYPFKHISEVIDVISATNLIYLCDLEKEIDCLNGDYLKIFNYSEIQDIIILISNSEISRINCNSEFFNKYLLFVDNTNNIIASLKQTSNFYIKINNYCYELSYFNIETLDQIINTN